MSDEEKVEFIQTETGTTYAVARIALIRAGGDVALAVALICDGVKQ